MRTYDFRERHDRGKEAERFIYEAFQGRFCVIPAPRYLQDQGVDFTFSGQSGVFKVELKTDDRAHQTGNAFIETVSNDREGLLGWAHTSQADWLLYWVPGRHQCYRLAMGDIRDRVPHWRQVHDERSIPNKGYGGDYNTIGLLVPLLELAAISLEVMAL